MATMRDVALRAEVSVTTVSHVVNQTRFVSEPVRRRVEAAMRDLGYRPNILARGLRRGEASTLGLIIPDMTNPYFAEVARSVEDACAREGYALIVCNSDGRRDRELRAVEVLAANRVGGLVLVNVGVTEREAAIFEDLAIPLVMLDREIPGFPVDSIQVDNALGGRQATDHLTGLGHRRIACIAGPPRVSPSGDRVLGYRQALEAAGLPHDPDLILFGDFTPPSGRACTQALLRLPDPPTAIFAGNDLMAFGALNALAEAGLSVPGDVSVVGFDDIQLASFFNPPLTTVAQPRQEMGRRAVEILLERMRDRSLPHRRPVLMETTLRVRRSTGPRSGGGLRE
jgi:LacI family transcriptional regulator